MEVIKVKNWQVALHKYLTGEANKPFEWGILDCTTLAIECLKVMTSKKINVPPLTYRNKEEALQFGENFDLVEGMKEQLNAYEVPPNYQTDGDIIAVYEGNNTFPCIHICIGAKCVSSLPEHGVKSFPTKLVLKEGAKSKMVILRFN